MKDMGKILMVVAIVATMGFSLVIKGGGPYQKLIGNERIANGNPIPYLGGSRSPGDKIGTTWYDYQANGSFGQRIDVDDKGQAHINWMAQDSAANKRFCGWNARYTDGTYFGETPGSPSWSGYVQLDITRDANADTQRTVIAYHYDAGQGYFSWIDIDGGNLWGTWPNDPKTPSATDQIWPYIAVANNGNIVMVSAKYGGADQHLWLTTDAGNSWTEKMAVDSCGTVSQFVRASQNSGSNKVVYIWTQYIEIVDSNNDQINNDVYYVLSTDGGVTWGNPVNLTHYKPFSQVSDTATWAYCDVNGVFDRNDHLHIVWGAYQAHIDNDTLHVFDRAKIFHWDEVSNTISVVNSPSTYYNQPEGWWLDEFDRAGGWRTAADQPQLIVDPNSDTLFCLWHGQDDTTDYSDTVGKPANFNGELYASYSTDNGLTWAKYVNLTNTRTPGGAAGACDDEDYATVCPLLVNDSIFITYVEDKDAGACVGGPESERTENPVRCWVIDKHTFMGIAEHSQADRPVNTSLTLYPNPVSGCATISYNIAHSGNIVLNLYDVTGRQVRTIDQGYRNTGTYSVNLSTRNLANGTYFVLLQAPEKKVSRTVVVTH